MECLVTQLKGQVADNLLKLGEFRFSIVEYGASDTLEAFYIYPTEGIYLKIKALEGHFTNTQRENKGTELSVTAMEPAVCASSGAVLSVEDKYQIKKILVGQSSKIPALAFDLSTLSGVSLEELQITSKSKLTGDISYLSHMHNLTKLVLASQNQLVGDIASLANLRNLKTLNLSTCSSITGNASCIKGLPITVLTLPYTNIDITLQDIPEAVTTAQVFYSKLNGPLHYISACKKLNYIDATGCMLNGNLSDIFVPSSLRTLNVISNTDVDGDIETFFNNQIGIIPAGATLTLHAKGTKATYKGAAVTVGYAATYTSNSYIIKTV